MSLDINASMNCSGTTGRRALHANCIALCTERGLYPIIAVDGGENATTAAQAAAAGATAIVAGSAISARHHGQKRRRNCGGGRTMSTAVPTGTHRDAFKRAAAD